MEILNQCLASLPDVSHFTSLMDLEDSIDAPVTLAGLYPDSDDDHKEGERDSGSFQQIYEEQLLTIANQEIRVRQFCFHSHNANRVWKGTFLLGDYLLEHKEKYVDKKVLELGSATGALAIALLKEGFRVVCSDIDDPEVTSNIQYNIANNGLQGKLQHIPHTWGSGWPEVHRDFEVIIASDVLLYEKSYGALVKTLEELFSRGIAQEFVMSWSRRIPESQQFFERMKTKGFNVNYMGKSIYSFTVNNNNKQADR